MKKICYIGYLSIYEIFRIFSTNGL